MKVLIADTETGGLDPEVHSVFSVGAVVGNLDSGEILETFEAYHKMDSPESYIWEPKAIEVHGITPQEAFEKGVPSSEICDKLIDMWLKYGVQMIGGHNWGVFDRPVLAHQIFHIKPKELDKIFSYRALDSLPPMRLFTGNDNVQSGASLKQAVKMFNIDMSEFGKNKFHAALFDSICCFKILRKFREVLCMPDVIERLTK